MGVDITVFIETKRPDGTWAPAVEVGYLMPRFVDRQERLEATPSFKAGLPGDVDAEVRDIYEDGARSYFSPGYSSLEDFLAVMGSFGVRAKYEDLVPESDVSKSRVVWWWDC